MNESRIIKSIKFHAIKHLLDGEYWQVDKLFSYVAAIVYPFIDQVKYDNQSGSIKQFVKVLSKFLRTSKSKNLDVLSFDGLVSFFISEFCPTVTDSLKKECLSESISLIAAIGADGFISWRGKTEVYNSIVNTYENDAYLHGYGDETYNTPIAENEKSDIEELLSNQVMEVANVPKIKKARQCMSNGVKETEEEKVLNKLWREEIFGDHYKECMPYVWKLQIPYRLYCELKEALQSVFKVAKQSTLLNNHCEKIFVYVAEWFKWEYQPGFQNNAFTDLDKNITRAQVTSACKKIWDNLSKWQNFRYSGESNDIHLYSIYALGGLPLLSIQKSYKIDSLFDTILSNSDDLDAVIESLDKVISGNSDAFRQSLTKEQGSWKQFIQALCDCPYSLYTDEDKHENELVKHFYERLENGRRASVEKVINHFWIFYTSPDCEEITGDIIVEVGRNKKDSKSNGCVAAEVLNSNEDQLYIGIECQNEIINYRKYSRTHDGKKYVGWGTPSNRMRGYIEDLSQPINVCKYNISQLQAGKGEKVKSFELGNKYIELYATEDGSGWTTLRECQGNAKAVFFPSGIYDIVGDISNLQNKVIGEDIWSLCEFSEGITLKNKQTGKEYNLYQEGKISVKITPKTDVIKYYDSSRSLIKCFINGQEQYLPLLMGVPSGRCIVFHDEDKANIRFRDIEAEYIQNHSRNQLLKMSPKPGLITLDIKQHNFKRKYIYLPKDAIKRNLESETIIFDNLAEVIKIEYVSPNGDIELLSSIVYKDVNLEQLNLVDTIEDVIQFRFYMTEHDFIELDVYRPINCRELSLANRVIKRYNDNDIDNKERIKLPYILRDKFGLKVFDKFGVKNISSFRDFQWFIPASTIQVCDEFDMYMYIDRQVKNEPIGVLDIGTRGWDQYKFYYWSVDMNEPPQQVTTSYDYEKKHLIVSTELIQNKKGLIFQSLEGCAPRHYVKAICGVTGRTNSKELVELAYKCYKMTILHNVTFTLFDPLKMVVENIEDLRDFYKLAIADKSCSKAEIYKNLHKLANEFGFEWFLLPHRFWRRTSIDKEQAMKFLQSSNFIRTSIDKQLVGRFLTIYLNQNLKEGVQVRKQNIARTFRYMRGMKRDPQMIPASIENVEAIKCLYESNEWINDLLVVFEN